VHAEAWIALAVVAVATILFATRRVPLEVTALAIPVVLYLTGVLPSAADALSGFGNRAVITLAAIFALGAALQESGVTSLTAAAVARLGGRSETLLVAAVTAVGAGLSALMSTAAVVALLLPAIMTVARRTNVPPSRLLLPLSFGGLLGCNLLSISSLPNLFVTEHAPDDLKVFTFLRTGVPVALAGILVIAFIGRHLLPKHTAADDARERVRPMGVARAHELGARFFRMRVVPASRVLGRRVGQLGLPEKYDLDLVAIERGWGMRRQLLDVTPDLVIEEDDELYFEGTDENAWRLSEDQSIQFGLADASTVERLLGRGLVVAEAGLAPRSAAIGRTLRELGFRQKHGLTVLAILRGGVAVREGVADEKLALGDALLVSGRRERVRALRTSPDFVLLTDVQVAEDVSRAPLALVALAIAVVPPMLGLVPTVFSVIVGVLFAILTRCLTVEKATQSVDWRVLLMTIGLLPLGLAFEKQGLAAIVGDALKAHVAGHGVALTLLALFGLASVVATVTTNSAAAVLLQPVATMLAMSGTLGLRDALLAVAVGSNTNFVMPHQAANLQVMGPGGYRTRDVVVLGLLLSIVTALVAVGVLAWT
jgi:di/tricarboxylate transporter